jgi:hypothetical protein
LGSKPQEIVPIAGRPALQNPFGAPQPTLAVGYIVPKTNRNPIITASKFAQSKLFASRRSQLSILAIEILFRCCIKNFTILNAPQPRDHLGHKGSPLG